MWPLTKMHLKCFHWKQQKKYTTHRLRLTWSHRPQKINNHSGTNGKPYPLWNYRKYFGIYIPSNYEWTGMDQLNVHQTWPPVPKMEKNAVTDTIEFIFHKEKPKDRRATYSRLVCDIRQQKTETHITATLWVSCRALLGEYLRSWEIIR